MPKRSLTSQEVLHPSDDDSMSHPENSDPSMIKELSMRKRKSTSAEQPSGKKSKQPLTATDSSNSARAPATTTTTARKYRTIAQEVTGNAAVILQKNLLAATLLRLGSNSPTCSSDLLRPHVLAFAEALANRLYQYEKARQDEARPFPRLLWSFSGFLHSPHALQWLSCRWSLLFDALSELALSAPLVPSAAIRSKKPKTHELTPPEDEHCWNSAAIDAWNQQDAGYLITNFLYIQHLGGGSLSTRMQSTLPLNRAAGQSGSGPVRQSDVDTQAREMHTRLASIQWDDTVKQALGDTPLNSLAEHNCSKCQGRIQSRMVQRRRALDEASTSEWFCPTCEPKKKFMGL